MSEMHIFNSNKEYQDNDNLNTSENFDIVVESKIQSAAEAKIQIQSVTEAKIQASKAKKQETKAKKQAMAKVEEEQTRTEIEDFFRRLEKGELKHKKDSL